MGMGLPSSFCKKYVQNSKDNQNRALRTLALHSLSHGLAGLGGSGGGCPFFVEPRSKAQSRLLWTHLTHEAHNIELCQQDEGHGHTSLTVSRRMEALGEMSLRADVVMIHDIHGQ